jgi:hypothetical protein
VVVDPPVQRPPKGFGRARRARDEGHASAEYAGAVLLVAAICAALLAAASPTGNALLEKICEALDMSCGGASPIYHDRAKDLPIACTVNRTDRTLGFNVNVDFIRVDRKDGDQLSVNGDGSASVRIAQGAGLGMEAAKQFGELGGGYSPDGSARFAGNGELALVYNLPKQWGQYGGSAAAQNLLDDHRDTVGQAVDLALPGAEAARETLTHVGQGIRNGWNWVRDQVGLGPNPHEKAAQAVQDKASTADAVQLATSLQLEAKGALADEVLKGQASANVEIKSTSQVALTRDGLDKATDSFEGSIAYDVGGEASLGVPNLRLLNVNGSLGQTYGYKVIFDDHGEPSTLTISWETRDKVGAAVAPSGSIGGQDLGGKTSADDGTAQLHTQTLDLTDPANRAAFDGVFFYWSVPVSGHIFPMVSLRPDSAQATYQHVMDLKNRFDADGFDADYKYRVSGDTVGGNTGKKAAKLEGWGVGGEKTDSTRELLWATGTDHRYGGTPVPLATCSQ